MVRGAALLACACACAAAPAAPLPVPTPLARPAPLAPLAPVTAAPACLHDADATDVSLLSGDARTIDVCFTTTACFAIDRRTRHVSTSRPPTEPWPARAPHRTQPLSLAWVNNDVARVCEGATCANVRDPLTSALAGGRADVDDGAMLITVGGDGARPARFFFIYGTTAWINEVKIDVVAPCADATWLDDDILVTSDDCKGGPPIGVVYDRHGHLLERVAPGRALDTHDATWRRQGDTLAIVAPRSYALVLVDSPTQQSVVDLVPIQAESTPTPRFDVASLHDGDWVVASATGGVGIVDHTTTSLVRTWTIPRCEASP